VAVPLPVSATIPTLSNMIHDCAAACLFAEADRLEGLAIPDATIAMEELDIWAPPGHAPHPVEVEPSAPFNIIYSSGTTGIPKGIVHSHEMRWAHVQRGRMAGYSPDAITLIST